jgi:NADP-dependent 3-hydroxy acid dehydrogenase YdfG
MSLVERSDVDVCNHRVTNWKNVIDVNLNGTANTLCAVLPHMLSKKYGRIVIIASSQGRQGFKNGSAYAASKWGVIGLSQLRGSQMKSHRRWFSFARMRRIESAARPRATA